MKLFGTIIIFLTVCLSLSAQTPIPPAYGDGSEENPYQISSLENLYWVAIDSTNWQHHYIQTDDIDATETINWFNASGWKPAGSQEQHFTGSYDGQERTIDGLYIDHPAVFSVGLFAGISSALISNLRMTNVMITGGSMVGSLAGYAENSRLSNCHISGYINGSLLEGHIGGLIGYDINSEIVNCSSSAHTSGLHSIGGLIGNSDHSTISFSFTTGDIIGQVGSWGVGGLAGNQNDAIITNCYSTGNISGYNGAGGLVGFRFRSSIIDSYSTATISGFSTGTGGLVGIDVMSSVLNSFTTSNVTGHYYVGGLVGYLTYMPGGNIFDNFPDNIPQIPSYFFGAPIITEDYETISGSYSSGEISGFSYVGGLAGYLTDGAVVNNSYSESNVTGSGHYIGGIAGTSQNLSLISRSYSTGNVISNSDLWSWAGGLVGENWNSALIDCYSRSAVSGTECTGGLVGENVSGTIEYCYSTGSVNGITSDIGGMVGSGTGVDYNSYWNIESSGQTTSTMGEGRTTVEMTYPYAANTFSGWDFSHIWTADPDYSVNDGYPYLREYSTTDEEDFLDVLKPLSLSNYPNPFNPATTIIFSLTARMPVALVVYNIRGQLVQTLITKELDPGEYEIMFDSAHLASGVYFYRLIVGEHSQTKKMLLLK